MRRFALGSLACVLVFASCSLGPREDWAEAIRGAHAVAVRAGTAKVQESISVKVIESVARSKPIPIAKQLKGVVDFANKRSQVVSTTKPKMDLRSDDLVFALPRSAAEKGEAAWISTDLHDEPADDEIGVQDRRFAIAFPLVSPALAVEMLQGVLTGSVEKEGTEKVLGATTTRYAARMAPDSVLREIDDEDREEGIARILDTLGANSEVIPVKVWLDDQGRARRIRFEFEQQQDRVNKFTFTQRIDYSAFGAPADIEIPVQAIETNDFQRFVTEFVRERVAI